MGTMVVCIEDAWNDALVRIVDIILYLGTGIQKTDDSLAGKHQIAAAASVFKIDSVRFDYHIVVPLYFIIRSINEKYMYFILKNDILLNC